MDLIQSYTVGKRLNIDEDGNPMMTRKRCQEEDTQKESTSTAKNAYVSPTHSLVESDNEADIAHFSDEDSDAMDELINSSHCTDHNKSLDNDKNVSTLELGNKGDSIIVEHYIEEKPTAYLEPVSDLLASNVTSWCHVPPKREETKKLFDNSLCPENIQGLQPVWINEMLYKTLPKSAKIADQKLKGINTFIARSMGPVVKTFENLCQVEAELQKTVDMSRVEDVIKVGEVCMDIKNLRKHLAASLKLSAAAHSIILQRRKANLKIHIEPRFHFLTHDSNPVTNQLFGDNLEQSVTDCSKIAEVANKVCVSQSRDLYKNRSGKRYNGGFASRGGGYRRSNFGSNQRYQSQSSSFYRRGDRRPSRSGGGAFILAS